MSRYEGYEGSKGGGRTPSKSGANFGRDRSSSNRFKKI